MKKTIKSLLILFLLSLLMSNVLSVSAASSLMISVGGVSGKAGETVIVPITINNNSGFVSLSIDVTYDESSLILTSVNDLGLIGNEYHTSYYSSPCRLTWENDVLNKNITSTGKIVELCFTIKSSAKSGEYKISLSANKDDALDASGNEVGVSFSNGIISVVEDHECDFGEWSYYSEKYHVRSCSGCDEKEYERHDWDDGVIIEEATHENHGEIRYTCADCGCTDDDIIYSDGHDFTAWSKYNTTQHKRTCSCGEVEYADHAWDNGVITQQPTASADGIKTFTCSVCKATKTELIPATKSTKFIVQDAVVTSGDTVRITISLQNSPGIMGLHLQLLHGEGFAFSHTISCPNSSGCTVIKDGTNPNLMNIILISSSIYSDGDLVILEYTISDNVPNGKYDFVITFKDAFDENFDDVVCQTQNGVITVDRHTHTFSAWSEHNTTQHKRTCSCGEVEYADHTWDAGTVTTKPTCIKQGIKTYTCSVCKATKTDTLPTISDHSIIHVDAVAPTCEKWGNVEYWYCDNCGYAWLDAGLTQNTTLKYVSLEPSHKLVHVKAVAATCDAYGNIEYWYCTACDWMETIGGVATDRFSLIIPATGHSWNSGVVTTPPTSSSEGIKTYTCNTCKATKTEKIPPILDGNSPTIVVGSGKATPGSEITVTVSLKNNPGIVSMKVLLSYDTNSLELVSASAGAFSGVAFGDKTKSPFVINWIDSISPNNKTNGVFATLVFKVKDNASEGTYTISASYKPSDIYNYDFENVSFATVNGSVTVIDYIPGDVNSDGTVDNKDLGILMRYLNLWNVSINKDAADVDKDGDITNKDYGLLMRYLNNWEVELK